MRSQGKRGASLPEQRVPSGYEDVLSRGLLADPITGRLENAAPWAVGVTGGTCRAAQRWA